MLKEFVIEAINALSFRVKVRRDGRSAGEAIFAEVPDPAHGQVWQERVDINPKDTGLGLATEPLLAGDEHIRKTKPGGLRRFLATNGNQFRKYTDQIPDENLVDMGDDGSIYFEL